MAETETADILDKQLFIVGINNELTEPKIQYVIEYNGTPEVKSNSINGFIKSRYEMVNEEISSVDDEEDELDVIGEKVLFIFYPSEEGAGLYISDGDVTISRESINSTKEILAKQADDIAPIVFDKNVTEMNNIVMDLNKLNETIVAFYKDGKKTNIETGEQNQTYIDILSLFIKSVNEMLNIPIMKKFISLDAKTRKTVLGNYANINKILREVLKIQVDFRQFTSENTDIHRQLMNILLEGSIERNMEGDISKYPSEASENDKFKKISESVYTIPLSSFANKFLYNLKEIGKDSHDKLQSKIAKGYPMYINFVIGLISENINKINNSISTIHEALVVPTVQTKINQEVRKKMKTQILTFLKIRNDDKDTQIYNRRFNVSLGGISEDIESKLPKQLLLGYNDDNEEYYKSTEGQLIPANTIPDKFEKTGNLDISLAAGAKYDNEYLFGDFTKIFTPDKTNADIASQMDIIKSQLKGIDNLPPKPVFIIGYGASGAGKTCTLIHYKDGKTENERNGILVQLCNQLGADGSYTHIEVQYREFYDSGKDRNFTENPIYTDCKPAQFVYEKEFVLSEQYCHTNHHSYRIYKESPKNTGKECNTSQDIDCGTDSVTTFAEGESVGKVLIHLIDKDRHVKATTNNPNSSRSHSLVFVKLMKKEGETVTKTGFLIVGDFAGVENVFDCENPSVLSQFMNIKEDKPGSKKLFYEEEKCGDVLDPIGSNVKTCKDDLIQGGGGDKIPTKHGLPIYDFSAPELSEDFKSQYPILNKFKNKDELKKAISFVREGILEIKGKEIERIPDDRLNAVYDIMKFNVYIFKLSSLTSMKDELTILYNELGLDKKKKQQDEITKKLEPYNNAVNVIEKNVVGSKLGSTLAKDLQSNLVNNIHASKIVRYVPGGREKPSEFSGYLKQIGLDLTKSYNSNESTNIRKKLLEIFKKNDKPILPDGYEYAVTQLCNTYSSLKTTVTPLLNLVYKYLGFTYILFDCNGSVSLDTMIPTIQPEMTAMLDIVLTKEFYDFIKTMEIDRTQRLALSEEVCSNRRTEGYFINDSLKQIRNVIREMMYVKNEDAIEIMPNYIDICFDQYCPNHENCFSSSLHDNNKLEDPKSVVFDSIYKYLDSNQYLHAKDDIQDDISLDKDDNVFHDTEYSDEEKKQRMMYKDLLLCVFCVFNISKRANNPPPVPYIDINKLKKMLYFGNIFEEDKTAFAVEAHKLIQLVKNKYKYTIDTGAERNRLDGIKSLPLETNNKQVSSFLDYNSKSLPETITSFEMFEFVTNMFQNKIPETDISINKDSNSPSTNPEIESDYQPILSAIDKMIELLNLERIRVEFIENNLGKGHPKKYDDILSIFPRFPYPDDLGDEDKYRMLRDEIRRLTYQGLVEYKRILPDDNVDTFYKSFESHNTFTNTMKGEIDRYLQDIKTFTENTLARKNSISKNIQEKKDTKEAKQAKQKMLETLKQTNELNKIKEDNYATMSAPGFQEYTKSYIIDFLTKVDNNNAISAVGTLEFIDKLSKLNTVATICNGDEIDSSTIDAYKREFNFKPLYPPSSGGSKKNTRRKKTKKKGTRRLQKK